MRRSSNDAPPRLIEIRLAPAAVWVCQRFTLSFRDVEKLLAESGLDVSHRCAQTTPPFCRAVTPRLPLP
jgi:hypothetical protein